MELLKKPPTFVALVGMCISSIIVALMYTGAQHTMATQLIPIETIKELRHGYILSLAYSGQQGSGIRALASQQCWVGSFSLPMYIVEPFIYNSAIGNFPNGDNVTHVLRFSDYFDIEHFNSKSVNDGLTRLVTWENFLHNAPRNIIFVKMEIIPKNSSQFRTSVVWEASVATPCNNSALTRAGGQYLQQISNMCVIKVIKAPYTPSSSKTFTGEEMYGIIFDKWSPDEVTLITSQWRPPWRISGSRSNGQEPTCQQLGDKLHMSQKLLKHARHYERLNSGSSLAVMLRAEHSLLVLQKKKFRKSQLTIDFCLQKVLNLTYEHHKVVNGGVFTTADVGKFASRSWKKTFSKINYNSQQRAHTFQAVKDTVVALHKNKLTFEEWEESFSEATGGIQDRGYIAALQRTIASRADCLILMGGGNFQSLTLQDYLHNHPDKSKQCIYRVCEEHLHGM